MKLMIVMQGAPGSGKSTEAKRLQAEFGIDAIVSADDYHTGADGVYRFDYRRVGECHERAQNAARLLMMESKSLIVDNTNIWAWEAKPYVVPAVLHGYLIAFVRCHENRPNIHGVPEDKVRQMRDSMEPLTVQHCLSALRPNSAASAMKAAREGSYSLCKAAGAALGSGPIPMLSAPAAVIGEPSPYNYSAAKLAEQSYAGGKSENQNVPDDV
jgi:hypothetical protein